MNSVMMIFAGVAVGGLILIMIISTYNHFQDYIIRINEAEVNIDAALRKRFDFLNKSVGIIKNNTDTEEQILEILEKIRSKKLNNFELDRHLYEAINEFHALKEKYPKLQNNKEFIKTEINLIESESEIVGLRKYYNDIITDYNKMVRSCPSNFVALLCGYKTKDYFDGNNVDKEKGTVVL